MPNPYTSVAPRAGRPAEGFFGGRLTRGSRARSVLFAALALAPGGLTFLWALVHQRLLLYGDATAHLMIARRMVDSLTPGLSQWGSVWLPFPHWLAAPFVLIPELWKTGAAGSIPSLLTFAVSVWALHRIVTRHWGGRAADWAALVYLLNPCLLYLAAVPMTESVYLAMFVGAIDQIDCWAVERLPDAGDKFGAVWSAALFAAAGSLCRYDGWFVLPFYLAALVVASKSPRQAMGAGWRFCLITAIPPVFWFAYNQVVFHDWLAFARGPYSARQIYLNELRHGGQRFPGDHQMGLATLYYLRTVSLNAGFPLLLMAAAGLGLFLMWLWQGRKAGRPGWLIPGGERLVPLLLVLPLPWYVWAMFSGNVPIFIPMYWPHGYYNVRYGAQLLPAIAAFSGVLLAALLARVPEARPRSRVVAVLAALVALSYLWMFRGLGPITYAEALYNSPNRLAMEHRLAQALKPWQPGQRVLMFLGTYPGALADDGIPIHAVIQEANFGYWDRALAQPQTMVNWVVVEQNTILSKQINRKALDEYFRPVAEFTAPTEAGVTVYRRKGK